MGFEQGRHVLNRPAFRPCQTVLANPGGQPPSAISKPANESPSHYRRL